MPTVFCLEACHTQIFYLIPPNLDRTRLFIYIFYFPIANGNAKNCIWINKYQSVSVRKRKVLIMSLLIQILDFEELKACQ